MDNIGGIPLHTAKKWITNTMAIGGEGQKGQLLADLFSVYLESMLANGWRGACHDLSTAFYMTLSEYGFAPTLYTGVIKGKNGELFDHSWVEIEGKIYDFAIGYPHLQGADVSPPVFCSRNTETKQQTDLIYGVNNVPLDDIADKIVKATIDEYAKMRPQNSVDMYSIAAEFGTIVPNSQRKTLSSKVMKEKYSAHKRALKNNANDVR